MELKSENGMDAEAGVLATRVSRRTWLDVTGTMLGHSSERLSPLGEDVIRRAMMHVQRALVRVPRDASDPRNLVGVFEGRAWLNLSALRGYLSGASVQLWVGEVDPTLDGHIRDHNLPATDDLREREVLPGLMFQGARAMASAVAGQLQPARSAQSAKHAQELWRTLIDRRAGHPIDDRGLLGWVDHLLAPTAAFVADELMPRIALATTALRALRDPFAQRPECRPLLDALCRGVEGHQVCAFLGLSTAERLVRFGHWGSGALDIVHPRYADAPSSLPRTSATPASLRASLEHARQARELAVSTLASELTGPLDRARFLAAADVVKSLGGLSDWPLDALLVCLQHIRRAIREVVDAAVQEGTLAPDAWAHLTLTDLERIRTGGRPRPYEVRPLPGDDIRDHCPVHARGLVAGTAVGVLVEGFADSPVPTSQTIRVLPSLDAHAAMAIADCAGVVVTRSGVNGPGAIVASVLGRPTAFVPADAVPDMGQQVRLHGETGELEVLDPC